MTLEVPVSLQPMEALPVDNLPTGKAWLFEPKYDGFRCILFRDNNAVDLQSHRQRPLGRYSPEIIEAACHLPIQKLVFDGELIIRTSRSIHFSFDFIRQQRAFDCFRSNIPPRLSSSTCLPTNPDGHCWTSHLANDATLWSGCSS